MYGAPVSVAGGVVSKNSKPIHISGTDRYLHVEDISVHSSGKIVFNQALSPLSFGRLSKLADTYQRIIWKKLVFRVVPMAPTSVSGGYIASYISDPTDDPGTGSAALSRLTANKATRIVKAWEQATLVVKPVQDHLYTSVNPAGGMRLYSPGRFVLAVDSQVSTGTSIKCPVTVYLDWDVTLFEPSLESEPGHNAGPIACLESFYGRSNNDGLWYRDSTGGDDPRPMIPGIKFDVVYKLETKRFAQFPSVLINFDKVMMTRDTEHGITLWVCDYSGKPIKEKFSLNCWVIEAGDVLSPIETPNSVGSEYLCRPQIEASCPEYPKQPDKLLIKMQKLSDSLEKFETVSRAECSDQDFVISKEQAKLMGFL